MRKISNFHETTVFLNSAGAEKVGQQNQLDSIIDVDRMISTLLFCVLSDRCFRFMYTILYSIGNANGVCIYLHIQAEHAIHPHNMKERFPLNGDSHKTF